MRIQYLIRHLGGAIVLFGAEIVWLECGCLFHDKLFMFAVFFLNITTPSCKGSGAKT